MFELLFVLIGGYLLAQLFKLMVLKPLKFALISMSGGPRTPVVITVQQMSRNPREISNSSYPIYQ